MRLLYLSCHSILEHDEIKILNEAGHYVFSPGAYVEPLNPGNAALRPGLASIVYDPEDLQKFHEISCPSGVDRKDCLTKDFVKRFDAVIVMHIPRWIKTNWHAFEGTPVIWRTIGQSVANNEAELKPYRDRGLKIVRYSPKEAAIPGFIGQDAMIRFYKDPAEFGDYNGKEPYVMTANQALPLRGSFCNYDYWRVATSGVPRRLYGPENQAAGEGVMGQVSYDELKAAMRNNRAYLYLGTHPASYTLNFMEAFMTGIPMVCPGPKAGNGYSFPGHVLYEVTDFITNGENGFTTDDPVEARAFINALLDNPVLAKSIGEKGRLKAIDLFGKDKIKGQWIEFLKGIK